MKFTLEQFFGSKVRARLLRLFLERSSEKFYVREIARLTKAHIHAARREIANLEHVGLIQEIKSADNPVYQSNRLYYQVNTNFVLFEELKNFILKSQVLLQMDFAKELKEQGKIDYLAFSGCFVGVDKAAVDLFIVCRMNHQRITRLVKILETEMNKPLNYTLMTAQEFWERKKMTDKFLYQFLESKKIVLIDNLSLPKSRP